MNYITIRTPDPSIPLRRVFAVGPRFVAAAGADWSERFFGGPLDQVLDGPVPERGSAILFDEYGQCTTRVDGVTPICVQGDAFLGLMADNQIGRFDYEGKLTDSDTPFPANIPITAIVQGPMTLVFVSSPPERVRTLTWGGPAQSISCAVIDLNSLQVKARFETNETYLHATSDRSLCFIEPGTSRLFSTDWAGVTTLLSDLDPEVNHPGGLPLWSLVFDRASRRLLASYGRAPTRVVAVGENGHVDWDRVISPLCCAGPVYLNGSKLVVSTGCGGNVVWMSGSGDIECRIWVPGQFRNPYLVLGPCGCVFTETDRDLVLVSAKGTQLWGPEIARLYGLSLVAWSDSLQTLAIVMPDAGNGD